MKKTLIVAFIASGVVAPFASAADLPSKKIEPAPPPPPPFSWQGPYIGAYAGALLSEGSFDYIRQTPLRGPAFIGGGALGYNWQSTPQAVLGVEADFGYRGPVQSAVAGFNYPASTNGGVLGAFRVRAGWAFAPQWLAYATGGLAFGTNFVPTAFVSYLPLTFSLDSPGTTVRAGWTVGGGFEYAWTDRISVKGEYLYAWLANTGLTYATNRGALTATVGTSGHVVRGGVNYHFGSTAPLPVLAAK